ncbi:putative chemotaxis methyl-accepting receptor signaling protein [Venturia nashicola]|uniref:Putative chemotaxis methyl-accepting receptor signaling protein n=1 Tax=Venturia nashicola TaxID=86259 RepID=A0A4Z1NK74_9PEZI|nr:putative chemotaxis methyl-accepting receptor signaling protein [Venturia nashicola]
MLPWNWFSSKSSTSQTEPAAVAATAKEPTPSTDSVSNPADPDPTLARTETPATNETDESSENSEETETTSLTLEEQLAAARARMKRSSMVADALPADVERPRASMTGQRLKKLTSSGSPSPDKDSSSKRRQSKQNSMEARPGAPRRSSSVKNVFNAYYKIFGGKPPSKPPATELPGEEAERLRRVVRRYEKQLEEASNTIMLQDKVLAKWESKIKGINADGNVPESSSRGLDSLEGTHFESSGSEPVGRLTNIQESSREMLADFAMVEEGQQAKSPAQGNPSSIAEILRLTKELQTAQANVERLTTELQAAQATVEEQRNKHAELEQQSSKSLEAANQSRSELEEAKAAHSETLAFLETVKRTLSETQASHLETASTLRSTQATLSEKSELVALHETSLSDKDAERDALLAGHEATLAQTNQDLATAREKIAYLETQVGTISKEYQDAKSALEAAQGDLETAKSGVSNVASERDAAKADFNKISADYEAKSKEHRDLSSALETARSEIDQHKANAETAKAETVTVREQLTSSQNDVEKSNAEAEDLKKEIEGHAAARAEIEEQLRSLQTELDQHVASKAELQKELDNHVNSKATLQTELDDHIASKSSLKKELDDHISSRAALQTELDNHIALKADLQKQLDDHVNSKSSLQAELDDHVASKTSLQKELDTHVSSISALQKQVDEHATARTGLEKQLEQLLVVQADLEAAKEKISELQTGSDDQVRALQADLDAHVKSKADLQTELEHLSTLKAEHEVALAKVTELEAKSTNNQAQLETAHARIAELTKAVESHAAVQSEHASALSQLAETKQQVDAHAARIDELNKEIEGHVAVKADLESAHARVAELVAAVEAHGPVKAELEEHREKIATLSKAVEDHETTRAELDSHKKQVAALSKAAEEHDVIKAELESHREKVATLSKAVEDHEAVKSELNSHREEVATLSKSVAEHEAVKKELDSHREQVATLSEAAKEHDVVKAELESHRERVATLSKAAEEHSTLSKELESHREQVANLSKAAEEHAVTKANLESHQQQVASLSKKLEEHTAIKADLESHQEKVATLSKAVEEHAAVKADLETHKSQVTDLTKAVEDHKSVKAELDAAHNRLADLEKDVETHKADKGSISDQLATAQTALASATASHGELSSKAKDAEERLLVAEKALQSTKEDHENDLATLAGKVTAMEKLQEHNALLQQELKASLDGERAAKLAVQDLMEKLNAAESKSVDKTLPTQGTETEKSHLPGFATGAAAVGLAGTGALGLEKIVNDDDDDDEVKTPKVVEENPEVVEEKKPKVVEDKKPKAAEEKKKPEALKEEKVSPVINEEAPLPLVTTEAIEPEATVKEEKEEKEQNRLLAKRPQEQPDAIVSTYQDVRESDFEDSPVADNAVEHLVRSQNTLVADQYDSEVPKVQENRDWDAKDEPRSIGEGADEVENIESKESWGGLGKPRAPVEEPSQETDTATPSPSLFEDSAPDVVDDMAISTPKTLTEPVGQFGGSDVEDEFRLPNDEFKSSKDQFEPPKDEFKLPEDHFKLPENESKLPEDDFKPPKDQFKLPEDKFKPLEDEVKPPKDEAKLSEDPFRLSSDEIKLPEGELKSPKDQSKLPKDDSKLQEDQFKLQEEKSKLPKAAIAAGALVSVGAGAFGLAKAISDDEDESLFKESSNNSTTKNPEVWWASSKDDSEDLFEPIHETKSKQEHATESQKYEEGLARDAVPEAAQVERRRFGEFQPKKIDALEYPTVQESEQMFPAYDDDAVGGIDQVTGTAEPRSLNWVERPVDNVKLDLISKDHDTVLAQETETIVNDEATKKHEDTGAKLPVIKETPTEEYEVDSPENSVEELLVEQDFDSADETNEDDTLVSQEPFDEKEPPTTAIHHSLPFELEPVTLDDLAVDTATSNPMEFQTPLSPVSSTKSKRKSVHWEDIESAKSSPFEENHESSVGLGAPWLLNGGKDDILFAEPADPVTTDEPEAVAQRLFPAATEDVNIRQYEPEFPVNLAAKAEVANSGSDDQYVAKPIDMLVKKESAEQDHFKTSNLTPEKTEYEKLEPISHEFDEFENVYQDVDAFAAHAAPEQEVVNREAVLPTINDTDIRETFGEESDTPIQLSEIEMKPSTDLPEIPPRSPDRLTATPERSPDQLITAPERRPDRPTATISHDQAISSTEEPVLDNMSDEPQASSANSRDLELGVLPTIRPLDNFDEPSSDESDVYDDFYKHQAASDVHTVVPELFLSESEDAGETEKTHEFVTTKQKSIDEEAAVYFVDEDEAVQERPLLFAIESNKKNEVVAKSQEKMSEESTTKKMPFEWAPASFEDNARTWAVSDEEEDYTERAKEQIPFGLPLVAANRNTNEDLNHILFPQTPEEEAIDYYNSEQPRIGSSTTFIQDKNPFRRYKGPVVQNGKSIAANKDIFTKDEFAITHDEQQPTRKGKKGEKESAFAAEEDESSILADRASRLLENIKEAI